MKKKNCSLLLTKKLNNKIKPLKKLIIGFQKISGRNNRGKITRYNRGGGHKRLYRFIDWKLPTIKKQFFIKSIEYDPNRTSYIIQGINKKEKKYFLAPSLIEINSYIELNSITKIKLGNRLMLKYIPVGMSVFNVELKPNLGGQLARSAGTFLKILQKVDKKVQIKLPSGKKIWLSNEVSGVLGISSYLEINKKKFKKAGQLRNLGRRPKVRGVAMNPIDHPHGGGEGKTSGGRPGVTPWGLITKGKRTRKKN